MTREDAMHITKPFLAATHQFPFWDWRKLHNSHPRLHLCATSEVHRGGSVRQGRKYGIGAMPTSQTTDRETSLNRIQFRITHEHMLSDLFQQGAVRRVTDS